MKKNKQNKSCKAWLELCEYIDTLASSNEDEFSPREALGDKLFADVITLPTSISKLKKVRKIWLYGSNIEYLPQEIGELANLEYFDPYTSYNLHWFPYELKDCSKLVDSRISRRALYSG